MKQPRTYLWWLGAAVLFQLWYVVAILFAQTHPCDQPPPVNTTIQSGAPHRISWCSPGSDNIEAVVAYVDTVASELQTVTAKTQPSATGMILYESPLFLQVARGPHTLTAATYNRNTFSGQLQLGAPSAPFSFVVADETPVPAAPTMMGVSR